MPYKISLYERTIVFAQRIKQGGNESFIKYADLNEIIKNKILPDIDFNKIKFGNDVVPITKSIIIPDMNIRILGQLGHLMISMEDVGGSDKGFYEASKNYSEALVKENISAIGVNFNGIIEAKKADEIIKNKLLDKSAISILSNADSGAFKLSYKDSENKAIFIISIDAGTVAKSPSLTKEGILVSCNYHREIKTQQLMKQGMDEFQNSLEQVKVKFEEHKKNIEDFLNEG